MRPGSYRLDDPRVAGWIDASSGWGTLECRNQPAIFTEGVVEVLAVDAGFITFSLEGLPNTGPGTTGHGLPNGIHTAPICP
jgi:hypothetical protein